MPETRPVPDAERRTGTEESSEIRAVVRRFGALNVVAGLLGFVGPAVEGNDDDLVNTDPGLFLGRVAVNGRHALLHVLIGALGLGASRDAESSRRYAAFTAVFFGAFAAAGWRKFGLERGVHVMAGMAVDGWGNLGHALLSGYGLGVVVGTDSES